MKKLYSLILAYSLFFLGVSPNSVIAHTSLTHTQMTVVENSASESVIDDNPFMKQSPLPFEAPDFNVIENAHFMPAFTVGMEQHLAEINQIANNPEAPTFENTIIAMERAGEVLTRVQRVFFNLTSAHSSAEIREIQAELAPKLAAHSDNILLNKTLFERINTLYENREALGLNSESFRLLEEQHNRFVRAGALLSDAEMDRIREINSRLSTLGTEFQQNLLEITRERSVLVEDKARLDGMSSSQVAAAAERAKDQGHDGNFCSQSQTLRDSLF